MIAERCGGTFLKKNFPCTPSKNFCTKSSKENFKETDRRSAQASACFGYREQLGTTETPSAKRVDNRQETTFTRKAGKTV